MDLDNYLFGSAKPVMQPPESYESAKAALTAIVAFVQINGLFGDRAPVNWSAAEQVLSAEFEALNLSDESFSKVYKALKGLGFSANAARNLITRYGNSHWSEFSTVIRRLALEFFVTNNAEIPGQRFRDVIEDFPALADDEEIFDNIIDLIKSGRGGVDVSLAQLQALNGNENRVRRVFRAIGAAGHRSATHQFALLCAQWAAASNFGKLQFALWYAPYKKDCEETLGDIDISSQVKKLASLLVEFGIGANAERKHYRLSSLCAAAATSWREEVAAVVEGVQALEEATIETLLVMGPIERDEELLLTAIELTKHNNAEAALAAHIDLDTTLANRRARACLSMLRGTPDVLDLMVEAHRGGVAQLADTDVNLPRTWLNDARVEQLFERSVNELASRVGSEIFDNLHAGEETHLAELFKELKFCLEKLSSQLAFAAKELDSRERFDFSLLQRSIGKPEEGGPGVNHPRFSTDICLIFKAMDEGICLSQRATLIQAKRLQINTGKPFVYSLKRDQLNDIAEQTLASFLLLLGPANASISLPVIPARLMVDLMKQNASMSLSLPRAAVLGKSLGTWLLEDIIGLWTGDGSKKLVEKALGLDNGRPRLIFELVVQRHLKGPDGWAARQRI